MAGWEEEEEDVIKGGYYLVGQVLCGSMGAKSGGLHWTP